MAGSASMRDVAARAGVSVATVSHVINNTRFVTEETRTRVENAIRELEYSPDSIARSFKTGRSNLIGFAVPNISDPFFSMLIDEVEAVLVRNNYRLIVTNSHEDAEREIENLRFLAGGIVDGVLIASAQRSYDDIASLLPKDFPVVFIDRTIPFCPRDVVRVNTYDAVVQAVETLIQDNHRHIVCFQNSPYLSTCIERLDAYRDTMQRHGLDTDIIPLLNTYSTQLDRYLQRAMEAGASAIVAPNNITTMASVSFFHKHNVRIGKDIDLVAFQDVEGENILLSQAAIVKQPTQGLARTAAKRILERVAKRDLPVTETVLQANYIPKPR